ncbi:IS200/IS605 family transposase [Gibbsiella quercinecans]|uniref:IS200/IS605 family transposase n=1 Tax=Gibbsiella quercinecans TaxID=929813 RepID=UPI000EF27D2A|nr:IS200/IS605 family transposase [Gibbsiella quercinecans]
MGDEKSLAHTRWNCKYHIVFAPKYRRQAFYGERRRAIGSILRKLCEWKNVRILEAECCADHIHMLVEIPPKMSVSGFMGYLKGKSSLMLYEQFGDMKFKYRNREFWCRGYYVDTVGKNTAKTEELANALKRTSIPGVFPAVKVNVDNFEQVLKNQTGIIFAKEIWFW